MEDRQQLEKNWSLRHEFLHYRGVCVCALKLDLSVLRCACDLTDGGVYTRAYCSVNVKKITLHDLFAIDHVVGITQCGIREDERAFSSRILLEVKKYKKKASPAYIESITHLRTLAHSFLDMFAFS